MKQLIGLAAAAGFAALSQSAPAQGGGSQYSVTNATSHTLACGTSRHGSAKTQIVVLRPGQEWQSAADSGRSRSWYCDPPASAMRYRLRPGLHYRLVEDQDSRRIVLALGREG